MRDAEGRLARLRIVLCRPTHPGNIGAAARALKTMGLVQLALVEPKSFPHADATARASGAVDVLERARVHETLDEALAGWRSGFRRGIASSSAASARCAMLQSRR